MGIFRKAYKAIKSVFSRRKGRKTNKRKATRRKVRKGNTRVLTVTKHVLMDRVLTQIAALNFSSETFELADLPQYSTYIGLYEQFKLLKVQIMYKTLTNSASIYQAPGQITTTGMVHSVIDYNDANVPTSVQGMMNDPSYKVTPGYRNHSRTIYPKFQNSIASGVQAQSKTGWLNSYNVNGTTVNAVSHYGLKLCFEGGTGASSAYASMVHEVIYKYTFLFKDPK